MLKNLFCGSKAKQFIFAEMFSNPFDADTQARVTALIEEVVTKFATTFPLAYTVALVKKIKLETDAPKDLLDDCQLIKAPLPSDALKKGFLVKVWQRFLNERI